MLPGYDPLITVDRLPLSPYPHHPPVTQTLCMSLNYTHESVFLFSSCLASLWVSMSTFPPVDMSKPPQPYLSYNRVLRISFFFFSSQCHSLQTIHGGRFCYNLVKLLSLLLRSLSEIAPGTPLHSLHPVCTLFHLSCALPDALDGLFQVLNVTHICYFCFLQLYCYILTLEISVCKYQPRDIPTWPVSACPSPCIHEGARSRFLM